MRKLMAPQLLILCLAPALMAPTGPLPATGPQYMVTPAEVSAGVTPVNLGYPVGNAIRYGCDPSGAVSSTACIAALATYINSVGGGTAYFPSGKYLTAGNTFAQGRILIKGDGSDATFIYNTSANAPALTFGDGIAQRYGGGIEGVSFAGATGVVGVSGQTAFTFRKIGQFHIDNVNVINSPSALYRGAYFSAGSQFVVRNLQVNNVTLDGVTNLNGVDSYVTDSRSDGNGRSGWVLNGSQGGYYKAVSGYNNTSSAWYLSSTTPASAPNKNNFFLACIGDTSGSHNWYIGDSENSYFVSTWGSTQQSTVVNPTADGYFITSQYSNGLYFNGGQAVNNNSHGVQIYDPGSSAPTNIAFTNFQFGSLSNGANGNGQSAASYGLTFNGASNHIRVYGGSFAGNASGAYSNTSAGTDNCVTGSPVGAGNSTCPAPLANSAVIGSPTGGDKGAGTVNATGLYINGVALPATVPRTVAAVLQFARGTTCTVYAGSGVSGCVYNSTGNYTTRISPAFSTIFGCTASAAGAIGTPIDVVVNWTISSITVAAYTMASVAINEAVSVICVGN